MTAIQYSTGEANQKPFAESFAGRETIAFCYSRLKKGIELLKTDPQTLRREDAIGQR